MKLLLTGATGFIGQHFLLRSHRSLTVIQASVRSDSSLPVLTGIDTILHLGGKAHAMKKTGDTHYFTDNAELTRKLASSAKAASVKHFIYASSVKVYGNIETSGVNESSECHPDDGYGKSKLLAEQYLKELADDDFIVSIVRIPLVYGSGVKGNMLKMLSLAQRKILLPFGNIRNQRSIVSAANLVALFDKLIETKTPGIFIAGDRQPVSTTYLLSMIGKFSGKSINLIDIPKTLQWLLKKLWYPLYIRLFGSLVIDNTNTNRRLNFQPPYSTEEGIAEMVAWFQTKKA